MSHGMIMNVESIICLAAGEYFVLIHYVYERDSLIPRLISLLSRVQYNVPNARLFRTPLVLCNDDRSECNVL